jgi:hypothetical protein
VHRQVLLSSKIAQTGSKKRKNRRDSNDTPDNDMTFKDMMHFILHERELKMRTRREDREAAERARKDEMDMRRQEFRMMNMMMMSMLSQQHTTHDHHRMVKNVIKCCCLFD